MLAAGVNCTSIIKLSVTLGVFMNCAVYTLSSKIKCSEYDSGRQNKAEYQHSTDRWYKFKKHWLHNIPDVFVAISRQRMACFSCQLLNETLNLVYGRWPMLLLAVFWVRNCYDMGRNRPGFAWLIRWLALIKECQECDIVKCYCVQEKLVAGPSLGRSGIYGIVIMQAATWRPCHTTLLP